MGYVETLICRSCNSETKPTKILACPKCFAPLDVVYDFDKIELTRDSFKSRPLTMWRYAELLPIQDPQNIVSLNAGYTQLHRCKNLEKYFGLKEVYVKNDGLNPTNSFKDRPASVAVSKSIEFRLKVIGAVSTGNLAGAVAAHAAKAGMPCYIFIPLGIESGKIGQIEVYDPHIIQVKGTYDDANRLAYLASETYGWAIANITMRPYYVEGSKTLAFEVSEQLGWRKPDHLIVAVGSGALMRAIWKGFNEFDQVGLTDGSKTSIHGAQASGCAPVANAFESGSDRIKPVAKPDTIAKSIAIGDPGDGHYAIQVAKTTGGRIGSITDREIQDAIKLLACKEGIFTEPAGAVTIAQLKKLVEGGYIKSDESVVCCVTGNGLKSIESVPSGSKWHTVEPTLEALSKVIAEMN
ncbi:MAG TPA: threonine synthase [Candidatus Acidoferrum sp.]|nr:threonine synthase [Candidatus Acidoferrum sp.]